MASRSVTYQRGVGGNVSSSTIDGILKEDYVINNIKDTVNMQTYFMSRLKQRKTTAGRRFVFSVRMATGEGQGFRAEDQDLPDAGYGDYQQASGNCTHQYGRFRITGQAMHATNRAAFTEALGTAIKNTRDGYKLTSYRALWGHQDGVIAEVDGAVTIDAAGDTDDVSVTNPYGLSYDGTVDTVTMHPYFRVGMNLVFGTFSGGAFTYRNHGTITGILDDGDLQIEFEAATNLVAGDKIIRGDSSTLHDGNKSYMGILEVLQQSGTYLNIDRTSNPTWRPNRLDANANALSEDLIQQGFDMADIMGDGMMDPDLLMSNHKTLRIYQALRYSQKRIPNSITLMGGRKAITFNGQPWTHDKLCPPEQLLYLNMMDWCWFYNADIQWIDDDGAILDREENKHAFKASLYSFRQPACTKPANQTRT